jgi:membrane-associated phospholipid phosphatase
MGSDLSPSSFWQLVTRAGEAQILLPIALLAAAMLLRRGDARPLAVWWMALLGAATLLTAASKIAFIGWGIGMPELDFTGISGHAMFAAAVYPVLLGTLASRAPRAGRQRAIAVGYAIALLIGTSRVMVGAHSVSEVLTGLLVGGAASGAALTLVQIPSGLTGPVVPAFVALWLALAPVHAPASQAHSAITQLALAISRHETPYTRGDMLHELRRRQERARAACEPRRPLEAADRRPLSTHGDQRT